MKLPDLLQCQFALSLASLPHLVELVASHHILLLTLGGLISGLVAPVSTDKIVVHADASSVSQPARQSHVHDGHVVSKRALDSAQQTKE